MVMSMSPGAGLERSPSAGKLNIPGSGGEGLHTGLPNSPTNPTSKSSQPSTQKRKQQLFKGMSILDEPKKPSSSSSSSSNQPKSPSSMKPAEAPALEMQPLGAIDESQMAEDE